MTRILVATTDGLHEFAPDGSQARIHHEGRRVTALAPERWELWAILDRREIWHTAGVDWWFHVGTLDEFDGHCLADTRAGVIVGTSEAHLYRVGGAGLERVSAFDDVEGRPHWYTPWGGPPDARSISEDDDAVYVNIHVGGIARSTDRGEHWEPTIDIHADVHRVWAAPGWVFAASARGLAVSQDQGRSWTFRTEGLHAPYARAMAVCGDTLLLSASNGPRASRAAVYRGAQAADGSFEKCADGLPEWFEDNLDSHCLDATPDLAAFATPDGRVFTSSDEGASWKELAAGLPAVERVLVVP